MATYIGFFVRDLMLINEFGLNGRLDAYFAAAMVPMFCVVFLSMPFADALTAPFLAAPAKSPRGQQDMIGPLVTFASSLLLLTAAGLWLIAENVAGLVLGNADSATIHEGARMLRWLCPLLALSCWTIIGNAVLNARHRARDAALAQLCVPAVAIASILVMSEKLGVYAAIYGMLAGTLLNVFIVFVIAARAGIRLVPASVRWTPSFAATVRSYGLLAIAALLVAAAVPVNYVFAGMLDTGSVSAWAMGNKVIQIVCGLAGIGIASVVLPRLGALAIGRQGSRLNSNVYFLLVTGTWLSSALTLAVYGFAEPFVYAMLDTSAVSATQMAQLTAIVRIGSLQLPFVVVALLIFKRVAVSGTLFKAVVASGLGLCVNVALNLYLVPQHGVVGIAIASGLAAGVTAATLVLSTRHQCGFNLLEIVALFGSWIVLVILVLALYFRAYAAAVIAALQLTLLCSLQWTFWRDRLRPATGA